MQTWWDKLVWRARTKGCVAPAQPTDFSPSKTYQAGAYVLVGPNMGHFIGDGKAVWVSYPSPTASPAYQNLTTATNGSDTLSVTGNASTKTITIKLANATKTKNNGAAISAAIALIDSAIILTVNPSWENNPPISGRIGGGNGQMTIENLTYICISKVTGAVRSSYFPSPTSLWELGPPTLANPDTGYWSAVAAAEATGPRTWCHTENPYEAIRCGRCGNLF